MAKRLILLDHALRVSTPECLYEMPEHDAAILLTVQKKLQELPTVDAVEVCYCKDCRYARPLNDTEKLVYLDECKACYNGDATIDGYNIVMPEHFCSYGERKEG